MAKKPVVYKIKSKINGLEYIGSTKDWVMRKSKHKSLLKKDTHPNNLLQGIFNKHGIKNLSFTIVESVEVSQLEDKEQYYMDILKPEMNIKREAYSGKARKTEDVKDELVDKRIGNQFWKMRSKHGRDKIFATPDIMLKACYEYFDYQSKNSWSKTDYKGSKVEKVLIPTSSPFTLRGLCIFLGVNTDYFTDFTDNLDLSTSEGKDFSRVIKHVREIIEMQQIEGAMVGTYKENLVSRLNGLADKKEVGGNVKLIDWSEG